MAERPKPENQPPPIAVAVEASGKFFQEEIENDESFKQTVSAVAQRMGGEKAIEDATNLVKSGAARAINRIGRLAAFANPDPEARKQIAEKLKKDDPKIEGLEPYVNWDVNADPNGFGLLDQFEQKDIGEIREKTKEAKNDQEKASIELQADAISKGWKLMKNFYKKQIQSASGTTQQLARAA